MKVKNSLTLKFFLIIIFLIIFTAIVYATNFNFDSYYIDGYYADGSSQPGWVRAGDMDRDGDLDIVAGGNSTLFVYKNDGNARGWQRYGNLDSTKNMGSNGAVLYDVDSDSDLDIISAEYGGDLGWWENPGALTNSLWNFHKIASSNLNLHDLILIDLDKDGSKELVASYYSNYWDALVKLQWFKPGQNPTQIWENHTIEPGRAGVNHNHAGLDSGDIDKDGNVDIAFSNGWYEASDNPTGIWTWHQITGIGGISNTLLRDMDRDNDLDLVVSAGHHGTGVYWLENPNNLADSWALHTIDSSIVQPEGLAVLDLDNDNELEVIATELFVGNWNQQIHNLYILEKLGNEWEKNNIAPASYPNHLIQVVDINRDGKQDVISEGAGCSIVSYYENTGPRIEPQLNLISGTLQNGRTVTVTGLNFGSHGDNSPSDTTTLALKFDNFESGKTGLQISNNWQLGKGEADGGFYYNVPVYYDENQRSGSSQSTKHSFNITISESGFGINTSSGWSELYVSYWRRLDIEDLDNVYFVDFEIIGNSGTKTGYHGPGVPALIQQRGDGLGLQADYNDPYPGIGGVDILDVGTWENDAWSQIEVWIRVGDPNQALKYWQDGKLILNYDSPDDFPWGVGPYLGDDNSLFDKIWFGYYIEFVTGGYAQFDDTYIDSTQARIELCDKPTWSEKDLNGGHCEVQIPITWSGNTITFTTSQGAFQNGETVYLYIVDGYGNVNENGYETKIGVSDTIPPIVSKKQPSGQLAKGTASATLSLETNEIAECRYSETKDSSFDNMITFTNTNSKSHSTTVKVENGAAYTFYVKCKDTEGNINADAGTIEFSVGAASDTGGGSGGSSGGSGTSGEKGKEVKEVAQTKIVGVTEAGQTQELEYTIEDLAVTNIEITAKEKISGGQITVKEATADKVNLSIPKGWVVYKYLEILKTEIEDEQIDSVKISFKVNKSWYKENNYNPATTVLKRKIKDSWEDLPTKKDSEDNDYFYFYSQSSSLSYFAIVAKKTVSSKKLLICLLIITFILLLILFILFKRRESRLKKNFTETAQ